MAKIISRTEAFTVTVELNRGATPFELALAHVIAGIAVDAPEGAKETFSVEGVPEYDAFGFDGRLLTITKKKLPKKELISIIAYLAEAEKTPDEQALFGVMNGFLSAMVGQEQSQESAKDEATTEAARVSKQERKERKERAGVRRLAEVKAAAEARREDPKSMGQRMAGGAIHRSRISRLARFARGALKG